MTEKRYGFDPYRVWLGIPANRRPPTYYDILGIEPGESDEDVIRSAAEQRRTFVQSKQGGDHDLVIAKILHQINEGVATLLVPQVKYEYDRRIGLIGKRKSSRLTHPNPSWFDYLPVRVYGEGSGIVRTFAGIMLVICLGVGAMYWVSSTLPLIKMGSDASAKSSEQSHLDNQIQSSEVPDGLLVADEEESVQGDSTDQGEAPASNTKYTAMSSSEVGDSSPELGPNEADLSSSVANASEVRPEGHTQTVPETISTQMPTPKAKTGVLRGHEAYVTSIDFSLDSGLLVSCSNDKSIRLWDVKTEQVVWAKSLFNVNGQHVKFSPNGKTIWARSMNEILSLDIKDGEVLARLQIRGMAPGSAFTPNCDRLYVPVGGSKIVCVALPQLKIIDEANNGVSQIAADEKGRLLTGGFEKNPLFEMWSVKDERQLFVSKIRRPLRVTSIQFSHDATMFAVATGPGSDTAESRDVRLFRAANGSELRNYGKPPNWQWAVAFSPNDSLIAMGGGGSEDDWYGHKANVDRTVRVLDTKSGQLAASFSGHQAAIMGLCFSPNGKQLASCSSDSTIRLWSIK